MLVRKVVCVGTPPVGLEVGSVGRVLDVPYGGRDAEVVEFVLADTIVGEGSAVEEENVAGEEGGGTTRLGVIVVESTLVIVEDASSVTVFVWGKEAELMIVVRTSTEMTSVSVTVLVVSSAVMAVVISINVVVVGGDAVTVSTTVVVTCVELLPPPSMGTTE